MQFPIYDTHFYLGFFVLIWLASDSYKRYRSSKNISTMYIALASFTLGLSMFCWGFPALITSDPKTLSLFTFFGDSLQATSFLFLWLLSIRAFIGSKPKLKFAANTFVILLAALCITDAAMRNLSSPYTTTLATKSSSTFDIIFASSLSYSILTAINSLSLFMLSFYFWKQGSSAPNPAQKVRIKSLAIAFFFTSLLYIALPAIPLSEIEIKDITLTIIFIIIVSSAIFSHYINKNTKKY